MQSSLTLAELSKSNFNFVLFLNRVTLSILSIIYLNWSIIIDVCIGVVNVLFSGGSVMLKRTATVSTSPLLHWTSHLMKVYCAKNTFETHLKQYFLVFKLLFVFNLPNLNGWYLFLFEKVIVWTACKLLWPFSALKSLHKKYNI